MKKRFLFFTALIALAVVFPSCSKSGGDLIDLEPCGIQLPIDQEFLDKGLSVEAYGTDMAIYPVAIIGFSYAPAIQGLYADLSSKWEDFQSEEDFQAFYREFEEKVAVHQKLIAELAVIPTEDYESLMKNPLEGYSFITDMKVIAKKHGNTYLLSEKENTTEGMDEGEAEVFIECRDKALKAIKKAKYKKIKVEAANSYSGKKVEFPMFASMDLDGNSVTEQIFSKSPINVLVLWKSGEKSSADFMKDFSSWIKSLPADVAAVGIVCDINSPADAEKISGAKNVSGNAFVNIIAAGDLESLGAEFDTFPVVMLVDADGDTWGSPIENATIDGCIEMVSLWKEAESLEHSEE